MIKRNRCSILKLFLCVLFFATSNMAFGKQEIYTSNELLTLNRTNIGWVSSFFNSAKTLKAHGNTTQQIKENLIKQGILFEGCSYSLDDFDMSDSTLPSLIVCPTKENRYVLMALQDIPKGDRILKFKDGVYKYMTNNRHASLHAVSTIDSNATLGDKGYIVATKDVRAFELIYPGVFNYNNQEVYFSSIKEAKQFGYVDINRESFTYSEKSSTSNSDQINTITLERSVACKTPKQSFYTECNFERGLYFNIEFLTPESKGWWKKRLAYEAYMRFKKGIDDTYERVEMADRMGHDGGIPSSYIILRERDFGEAKSYYSKYIGEIEKNRKFMDLFGRHQFQRGNTCEPFTEDEYNYLGAWIGFNYNLDRCDIVPTWIAYITTKPVNGPLHLTFNVDSTDIIMAMTVQVSESFYAPLGIYKSPIANAYKKESRTRGLSMPLHSYVARIMGDINPNIKYMVIRPLESMKKIFKLSGLPYSESISGFLVAKYKKETNLPRVRYSDHAENYRYTTSIREVFDTVGGSEKFVLVDPGTNKIYKIASCHWFIHSPYLGSGPFYQFPIITMDRMDLASYGRMTMKQLQQLEESLPQDMGERFEKNKTRSCGCCS